MAEKKKVQSKSKKKSVSKVAALAPVEVVTPQTVAPVTKEEVKIAPVQMAPARKVRPSDDYIVQTYFDRNSKKFFAVSLEFPDLKAEGITREEAVRFLEERIEDHIYDMEARGEFVQEPLMERKYPENLNVPISQSVYRRLDVLSRQEKVALDRLVGELLSAAMDRREAGPRFQPRPQQQQHAHHQNRGGHQQPRHGNQPRHQQNRGSGGGYGRDMDSQGNFMEYVRNLEKGGGGGWKKR